MEALLSSINPWLGALLIFAARVISVTMDTLRIMLTMRGKRGYAWILGFIESSLYILIIGSVIANIDNVMNVVGYAAGFATGNVIGMLIEERLAIGHTQLSIVSSSLGAAIAERLRQEGYAITEIPARGRDGMVTLLSCSVLRKNVDRVQKMINDVDATAFVTSEDVRPIRRGFWRA